MAEEIESLLDQGRIQLLSSIVAAQIAAGEVVERPACVVKELIENSIDAKATRITVQVVEGGKSKIKVQDDGEGIHVDDLVLSMRQHATSKVHLSSDLATIASLGFRGEALASIASVSRLTIQSRRQSSSCAWRLDNSSELTTPTPSSHPFGTTMLVEQLFYNTPARAAWLKSTRTEFCHVEDIVKRLALNRFDIAWRFVHGEKVVFDLPVAKNSALQLKRVGKLLGQGFTQQALEFSVKREPWSLSGYLGPPMFNRSQQDQQWVYVNGRYVRDRVLLHAVRQAYVDSMPMGRHSVFVIFLDVAYDELDVNVHPTKLQVRFHQQHAIHDFVTWAIRQRLLEINEPVGKQPIEYESVEGEKTSEIEQVELPAIFDMKPRALSSSCGVSESPSIKEITHPKLNQITASQATVSKPRSVVEIFNGRWLLFEVDENVIVVERHAIYKKQLFLSLEKAYPNIKSRPLACSLLLPLLDIDYDFMQKWSLFLINFGIELTELGPSKWALRALPRLFGGVCEKLFSEKLADYLAGYLSGQLSVSDFFDIQEFLLWLSSFAVLPEVSSLNVSEEQGYLWAMVEQYPELKFQLTQTQWKNMLQFTTNLKT